MKISPLALLRVASPSSSLVMAAVAALVSDVQLPSVLGLAAVTVIVSPVVEVVFQAQTPVTTGTQVALPVVVTEMLPLGRYLATVRHIPTGNLECITAIGQAKGTAPADLTISFSFVRVNKLKHRNLTSSHWIRHRHPST